MALRPKGLKTEEAVSTIRGKVGTKITITISGSDDKPRDITMTPETIKVPTVVWKMLTNP